MDKEKTIGAKRDGESRARTEGWLPLSLATGMVDRARGLLLSESEDRALLLVPCNDVHTMGMHCKLDVAFVDRSGIVVEVRRAMRPGGRAKSPQAVATIERFACPGEWFERGDRLAVGPMRRPALNSGSCGKERGSAL